MKWPMPPKDPPCGRAPEAVVLRNMAAEWSKQLEVLSEDQHDSGMAIHNDALLRAARRYAAVVLQEWGATNPSLRHGMTAQAIAALRNS